MASHKPNPGSETTTTYRLGNNADWSVNDRIRDLVDSAKTAREFYSSRNLSPDSAVTYYADQAKALFAKRHGK